MKKSTNFGQYYIEGLKLIPQTWFISLFILVLDLAGAYFSPTRNLLMLLPLRTISISLSFAYPLLLIHATNKKTKTVEILFADFFDTLKRVLKIAFVTTCLLVTFVLVLSAISSISYQQKTFNHQQTLLPFQANSFNVLSHPVLRIIISSVVLLLFSFTSIYFSVKKQNLLTSLKRSLFFSLKHIHFVIMMTVITIGVGLLQFLVHSQLTYYLVLTSALVAWIINQNAVLVYFDKNETKIMN